MSAYHNPLYIYFRRLVFAAIFVGCQFILSVGGYYWLGLYLGYQPNLIDCAYLTLITLTTIGYGEILPYAEHPEFRLFTMFVIIFGIGTFLYLITAATSFIFDGQLRKYIQRKLMDRQIAKLSGHFIICGAGQTGLHVCEELVKTKNKVVAIDFRQERLKLLDENFGEGVLSLLGDATEDAMLEEAGIKRAAGLLSALTDDKDNLFCVITARNLNPALRIVSRSIDQRSAEKIAKGGADRVVSTHFIGAMRMASEMIRPQVVQFLDLMLQQKDPTIRIEEIRIGKGSSVIDKTLLEAEIRRHGEILVLSAYQPGSQLYQHNPGPNFQLQAGMVLVLLGSTDAVHSLRKAISGE
jgi:voltage-gated potassium channel